MGVDFVALSKMSCPSRVKVDSLLLEMCVYGIAVVVETCAGARARACVCVCVCVCEREREGCGSNEWWWWWSK